MNTAAKNEPRIVSLKVANDEIRAHLADGRKITIPIAWSWRLANATRAQRKCFEIIGSGEGVHWPEIDEDISARGMLQGTPATPAKRSKAKRRRV